MTADATSATYTLTLKDGTVMTGAATHDAEWTFDPPRLVVTQDVAGPRVEVPVEGWFEVDFKSARLSIAEWAAQHGLTPAARWAAEGKPDPHAGVYVCPRESLMLGHLTDDELANAVFLGGNQRLDVDRLLAKDPTYHSPMALLSGAKDRIRWLSRQLVAAQDALAAQAVEAAQAQSGQVSSLIDGMTRILHETKLGHPAFAIACEVLGELNALPPEAAHPETAV